MKILYVTHQFFPNYHTGTERLTLDIAKQIQRMGHFVTVLTYEPMPILEENFSSSQNTKKSSFLDNFKEIGDGLLKNSYQVESIPVESFRHKKHISGFKIFDKSLEKHISLIIKNFDIVHFMHPMRYASGLKLCKKFDIPTVLTLTDNWLLCPRGLVTSDFALCDGPEEGEKCISTCHYGNEIFERYENAKFFFNNVDRIVTGSEFIQRTFVENNWIRKMELNPFSIDFSHVKNQGNPNNLVLGFIGTFIWHKGLDVLLRAFQSVENKNVELKIFGRGDKRDPYVKNLKDLAKNDPRIKFFGTFSYEELPNIMKELSIIVIPSSYKENFPLVMQLGLAYKKPIIATKIGGIPEVIEEGKNGFLFEPRNVQELSNIINNICNHPEKISQISERISYPPRIEEEALRYENIYRDIRSQVSSASAKIENKDKTSSIITGLNKIKQNLLLISHNLNYEGATLWLFFLSKGLKELGYNVTTLSPIDGTLKSYFLDQKINLLIEPNFYDNPEKYLTFLQKFDMMISNTITNSFFVNVSNKINIPIVLSIHESEREFYMEGATKEEYIKNADVVTFVANATKKIYSDLEKNQNFHTIYNAIDLEKIENFKLKHNRESLRQKYGFSTNDYVITIVGTVIERKGQMIFVEAALNLLKKQQADSLNFFIVGAKEGDYLKKVRDKIEKSKFSKKIKIIPVTEKLFDYYQITDIFVCTSFIESFPSVILEAMAFEIPIVSTDVYGIPEQIEDCKEGILIKPGDPITLAEKINYLIDNPELRKNLATNAHKKVHSKFTLENMIQSYDKLIQEILNKNLLR